MPEEPRKPRSLRRPIAGLVLLVGAVLFGQYLCTQRERVVPVRIEYRLGDPPAARIHVDYLASPGNERRAYFERAGAPLTVHRTRLPPGMYRAIIELTDAGGATRRVERPIEVRRDAVITVDLSRERP